LAHINHITHWRAGGFTVETIGHEGESTPAWGRRKRVASAANHVALDLHEAARRNPDVRGSRVLVVHNSGEDELAAYPKRGV